MADRAICSVDGCDKTVVRREWCSAHYQRWLRHGDPTKTNRLEGAVCTVDGCDRPVKSYGICGTHYMRKRRHGDVHANPAVRRHGCLVEGCGRQHAARGYCKLHYDRIILTGAPRDDQPARTAPGSRMEWLLAHVDYQDEACLDWPFSRDHRGYARITDEGVQRLASRTMCALAHGPAPHDDQQAAHSCGNGHRGCVNPKHLRWDTVVGNHSDKIEHGTEIKGVDQWQAKLTEDDVRYIRSAKGTVFQRDLAERYGVSQSTISKIQRKANWAWLD